MDSAQIPFLTAAQMREVDRLMIETYRIELVQMMENAGRNLARLAQSRFLGATVHRRVVVLAGKGGNGGGALVCARRLHSWGSRVCVALTGVVDDLSPVPRHQLDILQRMGVQVIDGGQDLPEELVDLIVDGIIGYSLSGAPRGKAAENISWANEQSVPILALDVPSGLDATTGIVYKPCIRATATMTLALPKEGLRASTARAVVGELYLADIGVPPVLYAELGLEVGPVFAGKDIVRLR